MMFIGNFDEQTESSEGDTFFRIETINGTRYYTRIYCHNGYLCELFSKADGSFSKEDGEQHLQYMEAVDLSMHLEPGDLKLFRIQPADEEVCTIEYYLEKDPI
jgi:hypothetical protein